MRLVSAALSGAATAPDALTTAVLFSVLFSVLFGAASVGVKDGPTNRGSVGAGEGVASETSEDADDGDMAVTDTVVVGMTPEKEEDTDTWSSTARRSPSEGDGVEKRADSVRGGVA